MKLCLSTLLCTCQHLLYLTFLSAVLSTCRCTCTLICTLHTPSHPPWPFSAAYNPQAESFCREVITCQRCLFLAVTLCSLQSHHVLAPHILSYAAHNHGHTWGKPKNGLAHVSRPTPDKSFYWSVNHLSWRLQENVLFSDCCENAQNLWRNHASTELKTACRNFKFTFIDNVKQFWSRPAFFKRDGLHTSLGRLLTT